GHTLGAVPFSSYKVANGQMRERCDVGGDGDTAWLGGSSRVRDGLAGAGDCDVERPPADSHLRGDARERERRMCGLVDRTQHLLGLCIASVPEQRAREPYQRMREA